MVCHVNSSKGNPLHSPFQKSSFFPEPVSLSVVIFLSACPLSLCPPPSPSHTHTHKHPSSNHCWQWICPSAQLIVYWGFRCQWGRKDPAGSDPSVTIGSLSPPTHFPTKLGRVNIYHPPQQWPALRRKRL